MAQQVHNITLNINGRNIYGKFYHESNDSYENTGIFKYARDASGKYTTIPYNDLPQVAQQKIVNELGPSSYVPPTGDSNKWVRIDGTRYTVNVDTGQVIISITNTNGRGSSTNANYNALSTDVQQVIYDKLVETYGVQYLPTWATKPTTATPVSTPGDSTPPTPGGSTPPTPGGSTPPTPGGSTPAKDTGDLAALVQQVYNAVPPSVRANATFDAWYKKNWAAVQDGNLTYVAQILNYMVSQISPNKQQAWIAHIQKTMAGFKYNSAGSDNRRWGNPNNGQGIGGRPGDIPFITALFGIRGGNDGSREGIAYGRNGRGYISRNDIEKMRRAGYSKDKIKEFINSQGGVGYRNPMGDDADEIWQEYGGTTPQRFRGRILEERGGVNQTVADMARAQKDEERRQAQETRRINRDSARQTRENNRAYARAQKDEERANKTKEQATVAGQRRTYQQLLRQYKKDGLVTAAAEYKARQESGYGGQ